MLDKILIIGSGALGTAFANVLIDANQKNVWIYGIDEVELNDLKNGQNTKYFGSDIKFNKINTTNSFDDAIRDVKYIVLAIPSIAIDSTINKIIEKLNTNVIIINGSKGFYPNTELFIQTGLEQKIIKNPFIRGCVSLLGPSFAIEIIKKSMTTICAVSSDLELAKEVQELFFTNYFKLYIQTDVIGAEVGSIYKNILAIGSGMLSQLGYGINTIASYLTRGINEMKIFNQFMGGKSETIYGLTGLGDLILTATNDNSRNFTFGKNFIKKNGNNINNGQTLEGIKALSVIDKIRIKNNLILPIEQILYEIIYNKKDIKKQIEILWKRSLKEEN